MSSRPAAGKRAAPECLEEKIQSIWSMSKDGISTDKIALYLGLSADEVLAGLAKRRRADGSSQDSACNINADAKSSDEEGMESLVNRLLADPEDLVCPILQSLMEHPVVAEDGFTYEQEAIEEALQRRSRSPKTNAEMGNKVLPNQDKKAAIVNYKEKTVEEIVSVAASVPPGHASKLLQRAESFIRPHLPDRSAQTKLLKILQLRAGLPAVLRGEAVRELVNIVSGRQEDEVSRDLLSHFEDWGVGLHLATVSDEVLTRFQALARKPPMLACHEFLDKQLARRLASETHTANGMEALWQYVSSLGTDADPDIWLEVTACVLAAAHGKIQVDLTTLSDSILRAAARFLRCTGEGVAFAASFFGCSLGFDTDSAVHATWLATLLLEQAKRCESNSEPQEALLFEAYAVDSSHAGTREQLLQHLLESLGKPAKDFKEDILLKLLFTQHGKVPDDLLPKLSLDPVHVQSLDSECCMKLAEQLASADRPQDGSKVAILAAQGFDRCSKRQEAQQAYIRAYNMDRCNLDASQGVVESCVVASKTCAELQETVRTQHAKIDRLEQQLAEQQSAIKTLQQQTATNVTLSKSFVWDISDIDPDQVENTVHKSSPKVSLGHGLDVWVWYYPQGHEEGQQGMAGVFLARSVASKIAGSITIGPGTRCFKMENISEFTPAGNGYGWSSFIKTGSYKEIRVTIDSVQLRGSSLLYLY